MSRRPSSNLRSRTSSACSSSSSSSFDKSADYAIIGDTLSAVLYADRLVRNGVTGTISIITEGTNKTSVVGVEDLDFAVNNAQNILPFLIKEAVNFIQSTDGTGPFQSNVSYPYYYGAGPCGDFISMYIIGRNGPWYPSNYINPHLNRFFNAVTSPSCLNEVEQLVVDGLSQPTSVTGGWDIPQTSKVIVSVPSILNIHQEFIYNNGGEDLRELGVGIFNSLDINLVQGVETIQFDNLGDGFYDIVTTGANGTEILENNQLKWQANPFSFLHLGSIGTTGMNPSIQLPAFYRAVVTIPNVTNRVNLNNVDASPDLLTTHVSFSLYDLDNTRLKSSFVWLGQFYTTSEDLADVNLNGTFSDTGYSLLIVECVCMANRRTATYNEITQQVQISANNGATESKFQGKFAQIVADVYYQYTGEVVDPDILITNSSACSAGICSDFTSVDLFATRASPMVSIVETVANLYGSNIYPAVGN